MKYDYLAADRDPKRFRALLNFLRTRQLVLEDGVDAEGMLQEAEFFHLEALLSAARELTGEGQLLIKCAVDARKGKLLSLAAGQEGCLPVDRPLEVQCSICGHE